MLDVSDSTTDKSYLFLESLFSGFRPGFQCVGGGLSDIFFTTLEKCIAYLPIMQQI